MASASGGAGKGKELEDQKAKGTVDPRSQKQLVEHGQGEPEHGAALQGSTLKEMSNDAKGEDMLQDKNKPKESGHENSEIKSPMVSELGAATADSVDAEDKVPATFAAEVQITPRGPHVQDTYSSSASDLGSQQEEVKDEQGSLKQDGSLQISTSEEESRKAETIEEEQKCVGLSEIKCLHGGVVPVSKNGSETDSVDSKDIEHRTFAPAVQENLDPEAVNEEGTRSTAPSDSDLKGETRFPKTLDAKRNELIFQLVIFQHEETDSGISKKPVIKQKEVVRLCHKIAPEVVSLDMEPSNLNLRELSKDIKAIGLYGNAESIIHFLCKYHDLSESIFCLTTDERQYEPGLYALLKEPSILFILYLQRHQPSDSFEEKSAVCFLRYLRELSTHIYVILKQSQLHHLSTRAVEDSNCDSESSDDEAYCEELGTEETSSQPWSNFTFQKGFTLDMRERLASPNPLDVIASTGHQGYAFFDANNRIAYRLEPQKYEESYALKNYNHAEVLDYTELEINEGQELLCLNCVITVSTRRILAIIRPKDREVKKIQVIGGKVRRPSIIRSFSNIDPTLFGFSESLVSWYDSTRKTVSVYTLSSKYREMKERATLSVAEVMQPDSDTVHFLEILDSKSILFVNSSDSVAVVNFKAKEVEVKFRISPGLLTLSPVSGNKIISIHSDASSLRAEVWLIEDSGAHQTQHITLQDCGNLALSTVRLIQMHKQWQLVSLDDELHLVSWRLAFGQETEKEEEKKWSDEEIIIRRFQGIFEEYSVCHFYEDKPKKLCLSFPVFEESQLSLSELGETLRSMVLEALKGVDDNKQIAVEKLNAKVDVVPVKSLVTDDHLSTIVNASFGDWVRHLICTVPIQIARIEQGTLFPLTLDSGRSSRPDSEASVKSVEDISFGLAESLFSDASAKGVPVKVISAQGRQSVGKSFFLNHLAGAHFVTSGWRCTEGIWMSVKLLQELLLVLLDFEGRNSDDRSPTEDCLLASFGAAISSVLVMKCHSGMESTDMDFIANPLTEAADRVRESNSNCKALYNAKLCIVLKDIPKKGQEEFVGEAQKRAKAHIGKIVRSINERKAKSSNTEDIGKLQKGIFESCNVIAQRPIENDKFYNAIKTVKGFLDKETPIPLLQREFLLVMKSMLHSLHHKQIVNADDASYSHMEERVEKFLQCAVQWGAKEVVDCEVVQHLTSYEGTQEVIKGTCDTTMWNLSDPGLQLCDWDEPSNDGLKQVLVVRQQFFDILLDLFIRKPDVDDRDKDDAEWVRRFQSFLSSVVEERISRVEQWIKRNLPDDDNLNERLLRRKEHFNDRCYEKYYKHLRKRWKLCGSQCSKHIDIDIQCQRLCVKLSFLCNKEHDCLEEFHICDGLCDYCIRARECEPGNPNSCGLGAGHKGSHDCRKAKHLCSQQCRHYGSSRGCDTYCNKSIEKEHIDHECSAQHICSKGCSAPKCFTPCAMPFNHDLSEQGKEHCCRQEGCRETCMVQGCDQPCKMSDHFHGIDRTARHWCKQKRHKCTASVCSVVEGRCSNSRLITKSPCALYIEEEKFEHPGQHYCGSKHFCSEQCPCGCLEYCIVELEMEDNGIGEMTFKNHSGMCKTSTHKFSNRGESACQELLSTLDEHVFNAVQSGALAKVGDKITEHLSNFEDPSKRVGDPADEDTSQLPDAGVVLCEWAVGSDGKKMRVSDTIVAEIIKHFKNSNKQLQRSGNDRTWTESLQQFIRKLINRRMQRVTQWVKINFPDKRCLSEWLVSSLDSHLEQYRNRFHTQLSQLWTLCGSQCSQRTGGSKKCQRSCVALKSLCFKKGYSDCNCGEIYHNCDEDCEICKCSTDPIRLNPGKCILGAEHGDSVAHKCESEWHDCAAECKMSEARNCMKFCNIALEESHSYHKCGMGNNHKCNHDCLANCEKKCDKTFDHESSDSDSLHHCGARYCIKPCSIDGCQNYCAEDHLHYVGKESILHFCKMEHSCHKASCSVPQGRCLPGQDSISSPSACKVMVPVKHLEHKGTHFCGEIHYCNEQCPCCGEFCNKRLVRGSDGCLPYEFQPHLGFCHTGKHEFAQNPVIDLNSILDELEVEIKEKCTSTTTVLGDGHESRSNSSISDPLNSHEFEIETGLKTNGFQLCEMIDDQLVVTANLASKTVSSFKSTRNRQGVQEVQWKNSLQQFIDVAVKDRIQEIVKWLDQQLPNAKCVGCVNVSSLVNDFKRRVSEQHLDLVKQQWQLCPRSCSQIDEGCGKCERQCVLLKQHYDTSVGVRTCSCLEDEHRCKSECTKCLKAFGLNATLSKKKTCLRGAKHSIADHDCGEDSHPCSEICEMSKAKGCLGKCSLTLEDEHYEHICGAKKEEHKCPSLCSVSGCSYSCSLPYGVKHQSIEGREVHSCGPRKCFEACSIEFCKRECSNKDHCHALLPGEIHKCDDVHKCPKLCSIETGRCPEGARSKCAASTPHKEAHFCGSTHLCNKRCLGCDEFCTKELKLERSGCMISFTPHSGLCQTLTHGTAKGLKILTSKGNTDASCEGEWCPHVCGRLGRGHQHIVECQNKDGSGCLGHHYDVVGRESYDQLTHSKFWETVAGFEDPCRDTTNQDQLFDLCDAYCSCQKEEKINEDSQSFCRLKLWHEPVVDVSDLDGHVCEGHHFGCRHEKHIILIIDGSLSMDDKGLSDSKTLSPLNQVKAAATSFLKELRKQSQNSFVSLISFATEARSLVEAGEIDKVCRSLPSDWAPIARDTTLYEPAMKKADDVIVRCRRKTDADPVIFFLTDGMAIDTGTVKIREAVSRLVDKYNARLSTCLFGEEEPAAEKLLKSMASVGRGAFYKAPTGEKLKESLDQFKAYVYTTKAVFGYK